MGRKTKNNKRQNKSRNEKDTSQKGIEKKDVKIINSNEIYSFSFNTSTLMCMKYDKKAKDNSYELICNSDGDYSSDITLSLSNDELVLGEAAKRNGVRLPECVIENFVFGELIRNHMKSMTDDNLLHITYEMNDNNLFFQLKMLNTTTIDPTKKSQISYKKCLQKVIELMQEFINSQHNVQSEDTNTIWNYKLSIVMPKIFTDNISHLINSISSTNENNSSTTIEINRIISNLTSSLYYCEDELMKLETDKNQLNILFVNIDNNLLEIAFVQFDRNYHKFIQTSHFTFIPTSSFNDRLIFEEEKLRRKIIKQSDLPVVSGTFMVYCLMEMIISDWNRHNRSNKIILDQHLNEELKSNSSLGKSLRRLKIECESILKSFSNNQSSNIQISIDVFFNDIDLHMNISKHMFEAKLTSENLLAQLMSDLEFCSSKSIDIHQIDVWIPCGYVFNSKMLLNELSSKLKCSPINCSISFDLLPIYGSAKFASFTQNKQFPSITDNQSINFIDQWNKLKLLNVMDDSLEIQIFHENNQKKTFFPFKKKNGFHSKKIKIILQQDELNIERVLCKNNKSNLFEFFVPSIYHYFSALALSFELNENNKWTIHLTPNVTSSEDNGLWNGLSVEEKEKLNFKIL
ncbi:hypothetical protein SNEBB_008247 [Seison nebaliae]|nr:hypothetical protein SNEBB_008247 [Seison nebaliae]